MQPPLYSAQDVADEKRIDMFGIVLITIGNRSSQYTPSHLGKARRCLSEHLISCQVLVIPCFSTLPVVPSSF